MAYTFKHGDRPLEGYTIQRPIGRGGFGEVYYAVSDGGREVALKYLRDNPQVELRGVGNCMNLKSPYLVTIFDVKKSTEADYFIIMEYISGPSLSDLLAAEPNGVGVEKAAFFLREIGKGLAYLHDRGIVHRDLKPGNIFYEDGFVKIGDYGLSKFISHTRHSAQTASVGTVHYMAPEVGSGNYHRGIDIYALGVMLYEMLLGRVPFEGSTMGEILMKHLTEQPEVADLPAPFGSVIPKALAKDPKDRYQTVEEMIEDVLGVSEVRNSLAGFNPTSISQVARGAGVAPHQEMPSPIPSPNVYQRPATPYGQAAGPGGIEPLELPQRLRKRMDRVSAKIDRKLDKLAGRRHQPRARPRAWQGAQAVVPPHQRTGRFKRFFLSAVTTIAIATCLGILVGLTTEEEAAAASAGMLIVAMTIGLTLAMKVIHSIGPGAQPGWVQRMITIGCMAPPMLIASLPIVEDWDESALAIPISLLIVALFADWDERVLTGSRGEWSFGKAIWLGLFALITCAIVDGVFFDGKHSDDFALMAAGIAGAMSLVIQSISWFVALPGFAGAGLPNRRDAEQAPAPNEPKSERRDTPPPPPPPARDPFADAPYAIPVAPGTPTSGSAVSQPPARARSSIVRAFWAVIAMLLLLGSLGFFIFAGLVTTKDDNLISALIMAGVTCASFMLFVLQKLTLYKRMGFWRETLCPFLIAAFMSILGACITLVATQWLGGEEFAFAVFGIVGSSIILLVLLISRIYAMATPFKSFHQGQAPRIDANDGGTGGFGIGVGAFVLDDDDKPKAGAPLAEGEANA